MIFKLLSSWARIEGSTMLTSALLNDLADGLHVLGSHLEDVVDSVEHDLHHLRVLHVEQRAERRDHILLHHVRHLQNTKAKSNPHT